MGPNIILYVCVQLGFQYLLAKHVAVFDDPNKVNKGPAWNEGEYTLHLGHAERSKFSEQRLKLHHSLLKSWSSPNFVDLTACSSTGCAVNLKCQWNSHTFLYRAIKF